MTKHKNYIKALEHAGIKTIYGSFRHVDKFCTKCNRYYNTYEEKRTDVNIAINLFKEALHDNYDIAIIISGDSDLIPAIESAKSAFPEKQFGIVTPINRSAEELKHAAHFHMKMKEKHLMSCRFDDDVTLTDGQVLTCPASWK